MSPVDTGLGIDGSKFALSRFDLDVSLSPEFQYPVTYELRENSTSQVFTGLTAGAVYFFRVRASNTVGISKYSASANGIPLNVPSVPQQVKARAGKGLIMLLNWKVWISLGF